MPGPAKDPKVPALRASEQQDDVLFQAVRNGVFERDRLLLTERFLAVPGEDSGIKLVVSFAHAGCRLGTRAFRRAQVRGSTASPQATNVTRKVRAIVAEANLTTR
jgi:hypothetical protein